MESRIWSYIPGALLSRLGTKSSKSSLQFLAVHAPPTPGKHWTQLGFKQQRAMLGSVTPILPISVIPICISYCVLDCSLIGEKKYSRYLFVLYNRNSLSLSVSLSLVNELRALRSRSRKRFLDQVEHSMSERAGSSPRAGREP